MNEDEPTSAIRSFSGPDTPIGNGIFGGRLQHTMGTGFEKYRTYGMYAMVLLLSGGGRYRDTLGNDRRVSAGDLIIVFPDIAHQYGPEGDDTWDEIFIAFKGAAFEGWRTRGLDPQAPVWNLSSADVWARRFYALIEMPSNSLSEATAVASCIHLLLSDAITVRPIEERGWLIKARQLLSSGSGAPSLPSIADSLGLNYETFRKSFRKATGETPAAYRRRCRLSQAALMLQHPDITLDMIADSLGFCDGFHLSKAFKSEYGESPASFRQNFMSAGRA